MSKRRALFELLAQRKTSIIKDCIFRQFLSIPPPPPPPGRPPPYWRVRSGKTPPPPPGPPPREKIWPPLQEGERPFDGWMREDEELEWNRQRLKKWERQMKNYLKLQREQAKGKLHFGAPPDREKAMRLNDIIARMDEYEDKLGLGFKSYIKEIKQQIMKYPTLIKTRDIDFPLVLLDPGTPEGSEFVRKEMPQNDIEYIIYKRVFNAQAKGQMKGVVKVLAFGPDYVDLEKLEILTETKYQLHKESILRDVEDALKQLHQAGIIFMDLKLENVGYSKADRVYKVFDFNISGIARVGEWDKWEIRPIEIFKKKFFEKLYPEVKQDKRLFDIRTFQNFDRLKESDFWYQ